MPTPVKLGMLGASAIILSKDIYNNMLLCVVRILMKQTLSEWMDMAIKAKVDPLDFCPESGETNIDVRNRTREFLNSAISKV